MPITREQFFAEAAELYRAYQPNAAVLSQLGNIDYTTVSGPSGMGKDTLIIASGLPRIVGDTVRAPRINNGVMERSGVDYIFRGHELDEVLAELRRGEYVQIGLGPGGNSFYGSRITSYPNSGPVLKDLLTTQIEAARKLPYATMEAAFVVTPAYEVWLKRLAARGHMTPDDWVQRRDEAIRSLQGGLDDEQFVFILNDDILKAAGALGLFATNREYSVDDSNRARNAAHTILTTLRTES